MNTKITLALGAAFSLGLAACATQSTDAAAIAPAAAEATVSADAAPADAVIEAASANAEATIDTADAPAAEATMVTDAAMDAACDADMIRRDETLTIEAKDARLKECAMLAEEGVTPAAADSAEGGIELATDAAGEAVEPAPQN